MGREESVRSCSMLISRELYTADFRLGSDCVPAFRQGCHSSRATKCSASKPTALRRGDRLRALDVLVKDLRVFRTHSEDLFREMTMLLTTDNFRRGAPGGGGASCPVGCGYTCVARRASMLRGFSLIWRSDGMTLKVSVAAPLPGRTRS